MPARVTGALAVTILAAAIGACGSDRDRHAEAARPPDSTRAPAPLAIDAAPAGTQAAEASGTPAPAPASDAHRP